MILGLGGAGKISAGFRVYLQNDVSREASRVAASLKSMRNEASYLRDNLMGAKRMYTGLATAAFGAAAGMARLAMRGADFGFEMTKVKAITKGNIAELRVLDQTAKKLAGNTIFRPTNIASAMVFAARTGQSAATIANTISPATHLAAATDTALGGKGGAMDVQTNIMRGFGIADSRMTEVADILTVATLSANTNLMDLGKAIKYTAATSVDMGTSLKETTSMIMLLGDAGMQSSQAGTAVENMQRYIARAMGPFATGAQFKALGMLGMSPADLKKQDGSRKDWSTIFKMMAKGSKGLDDVDKQASFEKIFGVRGKRAGSVFARMEDKYSGFLVTLNNADGEAKRVSDEMMDNLKGSWERLVSEFDSFAAVWSEALGPTLRFLMGVGRVILKIASAIVSTPIIGPLVSGLALLTSTALALRWSFRALMATIATISGPRTSFAGMRSSVRGYAGGIGSSLFGSKAPRMKTAPQAGWSSHRGQFFQQAWYPNDNVYQPKGARFSHTGFAEASARKGMIGGRGVWGKAVKYLGIAGRFLGRLVPILGILLTVYALFGTQINNLVSSIGDWISGTNANTEAIREKYDIVKGSDILPSAVVLAAYKDKTNGELMKDVALGIEALLREGKTTNELMEENIGVIIAAQSSYSTTSKPETK